MNQQVQKYKPTELKARLDSPEFLKELSDSLYGVDLSPIKFARIAWTACTKNPDLLRCDPKTLFRSILDCAAAGLEPDGRRAFLIPRKLKDAGLVCTWQSGYQGIKELLFRNRDVVTEHSDIVCEADQFDYQFGSNQFLLHKPPRRGERGPVEGAYAFVRLSNGEEKFEVLSLAEIEKIRRRSASPDKGPWVTDTHEMMKKTAFRRLAKSLPLSARTREVLDKEDEQDNESRIMPRASIASSRVSEEEFPLSQSADTGQGVVDIPAPPELEERLLLSAELEQRLAFAGFHQHELLRTLVRLAIVPHGTRSISKIAPDKIKTILGDWENCVAQMAQDKAQRDAQSEPGELPPDKML